MKKKNYDEVSVIRVLSKKNTIKINSVDKTITVNRNANNIGNGSWGKIDYLVNVHDYIVLFTSEKLIAKAKHAVDDFIEDDDNSKVNKRANKINMAQATKTTMRKVHRDK